MIDQISLHAVVAGEQVRKKVLGELRLTVEQVLHNGSFDANDHAGFKCLRRGTAQQLASHGGFTEKAASLKLGDYGFFSDRRYDSELDLAALDVKNSISGVALREDGLTGNVFALRLSGYKPGQQSLYVEMLPSASAKLQPCSQQDSSYDAKPKAKTVPGDSWAPNSS